MVHGNIDEIEHPSLESNSRKALTHIGADLSGEWWEDRYEISDITRKLTRIVLLYFIDHEDEWNASFLKSLELGVKKLG